MNRFVDISDNGWVDYFVFGLGNWIRKACICQFCENPQKGALVGQSILFHGLKGMLRNTLFLFTVLASLSPLFGEKPKYVYFGKATDLKTGKFVYSDHHKEFFRNGKHDYSDIEYKDNTGKVFGKKRIEFYNNPLVPTFETEDFRDGYTEGAVVKGRSVRLYFKRKKEDPIEEKTIEPNLPAVMDGGFDHFVKENWDELYAEKRMGFRFLAPVQLDDYKFAVDFIKKDKWKDRDALYLKLEVDNFVLKRVVNPFFLVYDIKTRRILQFEGLSNINDENGKSLRVKITYDYPKSVLEE